MTAKFAVICKKCGGNSGVEHDSYVAGSWFTTIKCEHCGEVEYL